MERVIFVFGESLIWSTKKAIELFVKRWFSSVVFSSSSLPSVYNSAKYTASLPHHPRPPTPQKQVKKEEERKPLIEGALFSQLFPCVWMLLEG